jgi:pimeloyl-ACP methyl ester carboxylesterase
LRIRNCVFADPQVHFADRQITTPYRRAIRMQAFTPSTRTLDINGTHTVCSTIGDGPPLLLLHGAEGSRNSFGKLSALLAPFFTVISYDQRDCGDTVNPAAPASLATLADDAQALLARLGYPRALVFGTSFGGRLAQVLALSHPACISRLVLASTWSIREGRQRLNPETVRATRDLREQLPQSAEALAAYFFPPEFLQAQPAYRGHFQSAPVRSDRSERRSATVAEVCLLDPAGITCRTLVIAGSRDALVPPALTLQLAAALPDCGTTLLEGVGHMGHVQAPEQVAAHLREFHAQA